MSDKVNEILVQLQIDVAVQREQIENIDQKLDKIYDGFEEMRNTSYKQMQTENSWYKHSFVKLLGLLGAGAAGGGGIQALLSLIAGK